MATALSVARNGTVIPSQAPAPPSPPQPNPALTKAQNNAPSQTVQPARPIAQAGIGSFPGVAVVGTRGRGAQLPNPIPIPGAGMQNHASVKTAAGLGIPAVGKWLSSKVGRAIAGAPRVGKTIAKPRGVGNWLKSTFGRAVSRSPTKPPVVGKAKPRRVTVADPVPAPRTSPRVTVPGNRRVTLEETGHVPGRGYVTRPGTPPRRGASEPRVTQPDDPFAAAVSQPMRLPTPVATANTSVATPAATRASARAEIAANMERLRTAEDPFAASLGRVVTSAARSGLFAPLDLMISKAANAFKARAPSKSQRRGVAQFGT